MNSDADYRQLFEQQCALVSKLQATLEQQTVLIQQLQQQIEQLLRAQFGKKSERKKRTSLPRFQSTVSKSEETDKPEANSRALPAPFLRIKIVYDVADEKKQCPQCEIPLQQIKSLTTEQWAYRPGTLYVKKHVRYRYACRRCSKTIITATMPNQPIEKGLADSSLLAQVIIDKYQDHLPLYRQECRWLRHGVALSRQTLCDWAMSSAKWLGYLVDEMKKDILTARKIHSDDTPFPVQAPGKTHQGRLWVYVGGGGNAPPIAIVYDYTKTRSGQGPRDFLKNYQGYLQADAYAGYDKLYETGDIIEVACMAHCRRKFYEAYECAGDNKQQTQSQRAIEFIGQLYGIEQQTKSMTAQQRYYYRRRYALPILKRFHRWLRKAKYTAYPKSLLGKAIHYTLNHWRALCHYCRDGILDIDNNLAERAIRPLVLGRKNYLFAGSHEGAKAAAIIYSIIETCKLWGVNTYDYCSDVLARLPNTLQKDIRQLLPYHWKPLQSN